MKKKNLDIDRVEDYFNYFIDELPYRDVLDLFLMLIEERPACLVMNTDSGEVEKLKEFCQEFELYYRVEEGASKISGNAVFITLEEYRLEMLDKSDGRFCGFTDVQVGKFLGFPEEDAHYFSKNITDGQIEPEARRKTEEMISDNLLPREAMKYIEIASYVPKPKEENIQRCFEIGKQYEKKVKDFDEQNNTDLGKRVLDLFLDNY